jgi:TM2 domain-containing membrane protein YozV
MNSYQNPYMAFPGITAEEMGFLQQATTDLTENQQRNFYMVYSSKRRDPQDILLFTLLGFLGFAGIHRFVLNQVAMGVIYFLTAGFCFIGTIVDLINHKNLTTDYNKQMAYESLRIARMGVQ